MIKVLVTLQFVRSLLLINIVYIRTIAYVSSLYLLNSV